MILANVGEAVPLVLVLFDGAAGLFPRARIYNGAALVTTVPLTHVAEGYYLATWTPLVSGKFSAVYTVFTDAGFTLTANTYEKAQELLMVSDAAAPDGGTVRQSFTFDAAGNSIIINVWLEIDTSPVTTGVTNATIILYNSTAGVLATPAAQLLPVGQGVFRFVVPNPGLPIGEFATFSIATIDHSGPPARTLRGITGVTFSRAA